MAKRPLITFLLIALTTLPLSAMAAGMTARAGLSQAIAEAQKWQKDAVLVNVSTLQASDDGTAEKWGYMFYSAKAKQGYTVDVKGGKVVDTLEVNPYIKDFVGTDFVDSDKTMAEAKKNGVKGKGKLAMSLLVMGQATKNPGTYWTVGGGFQPGDVSVMIEAKSGKFAHKEVMR